MTRPFPSQRHRSAFHRGFWKLRFMHACKQSHAGRLVNMQRCLVPTQIC